MFPQTQLRGRARSFSDSRTQEAAVSSPNSQAHNKALSHPVRPRPRGQSHQVPKQEPPRDVPRCDTQPMPSQTAFWTHPTQVHEDYDCTLNQTNIGNNNNKFYIIQLLEEGSRFFCWNRWGRVVSEPPPGLPFPTPLPQGTLLSHFQRAILSYGPSPESSKHFWWAHP